MANGRATSREAPPELAHWVQEVAIPLVGGTADTEALLDHLGQARIVMLGEASHGTHEFYAIRSRLTRRLIAEQGFNLIAIEGDWPDAARVQSYLQGGPGTALLALEGFRRFPTWMWRNPVMLQLVEWLRRHNDKLEPHRRVGFFGLDVYSLHASMREVLRFLAEVDPPAMRAARRHYQCFAPFGEDTQQYALRAHYLDASCEAQVARVLHDLLAQRERYAQRIGREATFEAEMNALAVFDAERYYREMIADDRGSWNLRDRHMVKVLNRVLEHMGPDSKAIVWEHNTHIGDFRATGEAAKGYLNVGQLVRQRYRGQAFAVGFGTYRGTVTAATRWDGPAEFMRVPPARPGSYESIFHEVGLAGFCLKLRGRARDSLTEGWLYEPRDERAIGVVYHPHLERFGNYLSTRLADRYDAYYFFDETLALEPLDGKEGPPGLETYPSGL